jgi:hypothetical protein
MIGYRLFAQIVYAKGIFRSSKLEVSRIPELEIELSLN